MKPCLVVIDMQPRFRASNNPDTIEAVIFLMQVSKASKWPCIILEAEGYGRSHESILEVAANNQNCVIATKQRTSDGTLEVFESCHHLRTSPDCFLLCGVNSGACVEDLALGLHPHIRQILVITDACNSNWSEWDWNLFRLRPNIQLTDMARLFSGQ